MVRTCTKLSTCDDQGRKHVPWYLLVTSMYQGAYRSAGPLCASGAPCEPRRAALAPPARLCDYSLYSSPVASDALFGAAHSCRRNQPQQSTYPFSAFFCRSPSIRAGVRRQVLLSFAPLWFTLRLAGGESGCFGIKAICPFVLEGGLIITSRAKTGW